MYKLLLKAFGVSTAEELQALAQLIALLGASCAFMIALWQYRRAERWKRKEFVAKEVKEFFNDPRVKTATLLIDWTSRRVNIELDPDLPLERCPKITKVMQTHALLPHTVKARIQRPTPRGFEDRLNMTLGMYSLSEALIRDTYDAFFDGLERFADFVESRLVKAEAFQPYLRYWITDLTRTDLSAIETTWQLSVLTYVAFYRFEGVTQLFRELGHDIRPHEPLWNVLKQRAAYPEVVQVLEKSLVPDGGEDNDEENIE